jgi:hypothetical protein
VELFLHSPNTPSWRGAQLKHRDTFYQSQRPDIYVYDKYVLHIGVTCFPNAFLAILHALLVFINCRHKFVIVEYVTLVDITLQSQKLSLLVFR